jgi:serine/threonine protein kinase
MISLARGIASGMYHLHRHNIIHRDLATRNVLLTHSSGEGEPKITDFGMSRFLETNSIAQTKSDIGPVCWMAPESIARRTYSKKSDVWSYGIVCKFSPRFLLGNSWKCQSIASGSVATVSSQREALHFVFMFTVTRTVLIVTRFDSVAKMILGDTLVFHSF